MKTFALYPVGNKAIEMLENIITPEDLTVFYMEESHISHFYRSRNIKIFPIYKIRTFRKQAQNLLIARNLSASSFILSLLY